MLLAKPASSKCHPCAVQCCSFDKYRKLPPKANFFQVKGFPEIKVFYNRRIGFQATGLSQIPGC